ncbi:MAG: hypothetical protein K0R13_1413 [Propionibacteriaceae bacterium]|nr:hypothetical protein [Propionibacteriaceae bacterium]
MPESSNIEIAHKLAEHRDAEAAKKPGKTSSLRLWRLSSGGRRSGDRMECIPRREMGRA